MTDFNKLQDRSLSAAEKWNKEGWQEHFSSDELQPFWVADMEFKAHSDKVFNKNNAFNTIAMESAYSKGGEWLDFRELGIKTRALEKFIAREARIAINPGYWFGRQGAGFARMTIAGPRSMLKEALSRLERAINGLEGNG